MWKKMMELNKPRGGWIGFKTKCTFKNRVTQKKTFVWILSQTNIWIERNQYFLKHDLSLPSFLSQLWNLNLYEKLD